MIQPHAGIDGVFVYGTLKRGQCRQSAWPVVPADVISGWVSGDVWGRSDYPALLPGNFRVRGELWVFDQSQLDAVLAVLDNIEGTDGNSPDDLYHRRVVDVNLDGAKGSRRAYTYFYHRDPSADGFISMPRVGDFQRWPE